MVGLRASTTIRTAINYRMDIESVIGFDALFLSAQKCKRMVSWKDSVAHYDHNCPEETLKLSTQLMDGSYKERPPKFFTVHEPKERNIMSISFRDRVYQRSLNDVIIYPTMAKSLIYDNLSCQKGKGTDMARERLKCHLQRFYRKHGTDGFVLQCDVKGYYPNMPHDKVKERYKKSLDPVAYEMAARILDGFPGEIGFNPGSQIIQIAGISYLSSLDHHIKERLRVKQYVRYMDDMILLAETKEQAEMWREVISSQLSEKGLELNAKKTKIYPISKGIRFLGFDFKLTDTGKVLMFLAPENVKKRRKNLRRLAVRVKKNEVPVKKLHDCYSCWRANASKGTSTKLLIRMDQFVKELLNDG